MHNHPFFASSVLSILALSACGGINPVSGAAGQAIKGYDPVTMRTDNRAVKGADDVTTDFEGATWHFQSTANRDEFLSNPEHFAPRFGGYCVVALGDGMIVDGDPTAFVIHNDTLYLTLGEHARTMFNLDPDGYVKRAAANWQRYAPLRK